jgi:predicted TPR repeat methyltransferase
MVKLAAARTRTNTGDKIYESVYPAEALEYLNQLPPGSIHGIVAADVFIYIGNLESIFQSSRRALVDSGVVVFSVELSSEEQGMVLLSSGRFGHSKEYIEVEARKAGFRVKVWKEGDLRKQRSQNVRGAVVVLEKAN